MFFKEFTEFSQDLMQKFQIQVLSHDNYRGQGEQVVALTVRRYGIVGAMLVMASSRKQQIDSGIVLEEPDLLPAFVDTVLVVIICHSQNFIPFNLWC